MRFVRVGSGLNNITDDSTATDATTDNHTVSNVSDSNIEIIESNPKSPNSNSTNNNQPITNYKQFQDDSEIIVGEKPSFKLPKFLSQRENSKTKLDALKKSQANPEQSQSSGELPFTEPNFKDNPNSFTSIFNKDHDKINGVQRVFRKSITFLILQLLAFVSLSIATIATFTLNLNGIVPTAIFSSSVLALIVAYTVVSGIFYIIVADRSYIWISLLLQGLSLVLLYSFIGQGFSFPTIIFGLLITLLSYFAYLEIEKVQVSTRFFSIGYVTAESTKILSTIAILTVCLGVFNTVSFQTPKTFLSRNLIDNETVFGNLVANNSRFSLNTILQIKGDYRVNKNTSILLSSDSKEVDVKDFVQKNYPVADSINCVGTDKECNSQSSQDTNSKLQNNLSRLVELGQISSNPKLSDRLSYPLYKSLLKGYYADKINDFETQKNSQNIPFLNNIQWIIEPSRTVFIPALIAIIFYIGLLVIKFLIHFVSSLATWLVWKLLTMTGFVKIEIELVESEIVSI